jgi:uncharacterized protein (UPF0332 family)
MVNLNWCKKQKKGISLIDPNLNLSKEYINTAEETLTILKSIGDRSNIWLAATKYYCEYFALYSLLMKLGIKCEIHDCTIELSKFLENEKLLPKGTYNKLNKDKKLRINNQYYLKNIEVKINYDDLVNFVLKIKEITNNLNLEKINNIRFKLKNLSLDKNEL